MRSRHRIPGALVVVVLSCLFFRCPPKRPPAIATQPGDAGRTTESTSRGTPEPVTTGPDVRAVDPEGALGEDLTDVAGEGGPLADVRFEYDRADLTDTARAALEKNAVWLQTRRDVRVIVEGHCDERGTVEYNLALGERRAEAARAYLVSLGVAPERLTAVSYGKERPVDPSHDEAAWTRNRRAHFAVRR